MALRNKIASAPQTRPNYATLCKHASLTANGKQAMAMVSCTASAKILKIIIIVSRLYPFFSHSFDSSEVVLWLM
jgi:hypothetical protein